jgi:hypothetical protein
METPHVCRNINKLTVLHACRGSSGQKLQYGLMTLAYQHFTAIVVVDLWQSLSLASITV